MYRRPETKAAEEKVYKQKQIGEFMTAWKDFPSPPEPATVEAGETSLPEAIKYLGAEHFLYASDIPHWDNEFPSNLHALRNHPTVSDTDKEKILYKNAKELFAL